MFERSFMELPVETLTQACYNNKLVPTLRRWLPDYQPILEAGCGSGCWVAWFLEQRWEAVGLDWSEALCARARAVIPDTRFETGDMRAMPFKDEEFGGIFAHGSIEHTPEGPNGLLKEFHRVLRSGGVAIITVPYDNPIRRLIRTISAPIIWVKQSSAIRRLFGKIGTDGRSLKDVRRETMPGWATVFGVDEKGWHFIEYYFRKRQMRLILRKQGFSILEESAVFADGGVYHIFGKKAGRYEKSRGIIVLSRLGKVLCRLLPVDYVGHMLCYVVRKKQANQTFSREIDDSFRTMKMGKIPIIG